MTGWEGGWEDDWMTGLLDYWITGLLDYWMDGWEGGDRLGGAQLGW